MSKTDLQHAFELIEDVGGDFDGKKPSELAAKAEQALGCKFPPTYKEFITNYGCGDIEGLEFYGLTDDNFENSSVPNAIWLTLNERKSGFPANLILIYSTGDGNYLALKVDEFSGDNENPVVKVSSVGEILERVSNNFGSFMLAEIKSVI